MKRETVGLTNNFHNRSTKVRVPVAVLRSQFGWGLSDLSKSQQRRVRDKLCGSPTCMCGVIR